MDLKQSVQDQFGAAAGHYAVAAVHSTGPDLVTMQAAVALGGGERVLDVGCGAGHTALAFAPHVREVHALDLTPAMLAQVEQLAADRGLANVVTRQGDAEALPFPDASFDVVTCRLCAHHFARPQRAVDEMARVLTADGVLLLSDSVSPEAPAQDTFLNAIELLRDPSHVRNYSETQWCEMLARAGLRPEVLERWGFVLDFEDWVARQHTPPEEVAMLRRMLRSAHVESHRRFRVVGDAPESWTIPISLFRGAR